MNLTTIRDGIILSNHHLIAFNKPAGMAIQSMQDKENTLEVKLTNYCKTALYPIHRIDQPCSGVVLFAKKKATAALLNDQLQHQGIKRIYLAVVLGKPESSAGTLNHYLFAHKKSNKSYVVDANHKEGKIAELDFEWLGEAEGNHLLRIQLHTGRHHQIRSQLAAIGCPIKGDVKYGAKKYNPDRNIHLHAWQMEFNQPPDLSRVSLEAKLPDELTWQTMQSFIQV